jgi:hypothetical protein
MLQPMSLTGPLPWLKGVGRTFPLPARVEIDPHRRRAVFIDYPGPGTIGIFEEGRVALGGAPPRDHRGTFRGLRKHRRWTPLDALYFFGYALTHYHAVPFGLPHAELRGWEPARRAITVAFPPTVHTHCSVQTFYFDETGLIVRHDYVADIVGTWARGAHYWCDYVAVEGIPIATRRRVFARLGGLALPIVALDAQFSTPHVAFD